MKSSMFHNAGQLPGSDTGFLERGLICIKV